MRSPAQDSVKPAGYPLIIRAFTNPACRNGRRIKIKETCRQKPAWPENKKYRAGKTQKRNDYPRRNLHSIISRNKTPAAYRGKHQPNANGGHPPYRKLLPRTTARNDCVNLNDAPMRVPGWHCAGKAARFNAMQQKLTRRRRPVSVSAESGFRRACPQGQKDKRKLCQYAKLVCSV